MYKFIIGIVAFCIFLSSRATVDIASPAFIKENYLDDNDSIIYIYRTFSYAGMVIDFKVIINNKYYNWIQINGYLVFHVKPGKYYIKSTGNAIELFQKINVEPNKSYYLKISGDSFKRINENRGLNELASMRKMIDKWETR
jgi:hypothetical protein